MALLLLDDQGGRRMEKTLLPRPVYPMMSVTSQEPADAGVFLAEMNPSSRSNGYTAGIYPGYPIRMAN